MNKCDICQKEYEEHAIIPFRLRIGPRLGRIREEIDNDYIEPVDINICNQCKEGKKAKIINKLKDMLKSD